MLPKIAPRAEEVSKLFIHAGLIREIISLSVEFDCLICRISSLEPSKDNPWEEPISEIA